MKDNKILFGTMIVLLLFLTVGLSYAYFSTAVKGNDNAKDMVVEAGTLKLTYTDGPAINAQYIKPGWSTTKEVSVKNNGTLDAYYNIIWQSLTNEIINDELVISATCQRLNASGIVEGTCDSISQAPIKDTIISKNISIESGITHKYTFTILFKETNANQNYNQGKEFNGVLGVEEYKDTAVYCTYDGELTQGTEYTNGPYKYKYMQRYTSNGDWENIDANGWGVSLIDETDSSQITSELCTYINENPIISMSFMFWASESSKIDLSSFDTSNVIDMQGMFFGSQATLLDLSNFDTSSVTNMNEMFSESQATTINVSSFDTSNVTDMNYMFAGTQVLALDLSSFDTCNVTDMSYMFTGSEAITINLNNFDTSKVTNMDSMFYGSQATTLDLSSFHISNVQYVTDMFTNATNLKTIYVSSNFITDNALANITMFKNCTSLVGGAGTKYDSKHVNNKYARIDGGTSNPGYFTDIADKK